MKKYILNWCCELIKNNNSNLTEEKMLEIRYGLEGIYLTITKTIFIFLISYLLNIFKEMLLMLLFFNIMRTTAFGLHAKKSWMCWVSSTILFLILPYISNYIVIPFNLKIILGIVSIILIFLFSPADTEKHPLINLKKRRIWNFISTINCFILVILTLIIKNETICTLIFFGIYTEILLINPLSYKICNLQYDNYKKYIELNNNV